MENPVARTRVREPVEQRRAQILGHAIQAIGERGYYGFTIQDLAERCGLTNAGLLHHYSSKDQVLLAVLYQLEWQESEVMRPLVDAAMRERTCASATITALRTMVERAAARPDLGRFFAELQAETLSETHPAHDWSRRREQVLLDLFTDLIEPWVDTPDATSRLLLAIVDGLYLRWLRAQRGFDMVAEWEAALLRLVPALAGSGGNCDIET
jgi:AcrR family transcriptional regulator